VGFKTKSIFIASFYSIFFQSGSYVKWDSFSPYKRKVSLLQTLTHRAMQICSTTTLSDELTNIRRIFRDNGYPNDVIEKSIRQKLCRSNEELIGPKKNIVYLKLPYKGNSCEKIAKKIENAVCSTYNAVKTRIILTTQSMMPNSQKDTLKQINKSEVVYKFTCNRCDS